MTTGEVDEGEDVLEALGRSVSPADEARRTEVLAALESTSAWAGRLAEPAAWWASVRPDGFATAPRHATALALAAPPGSPALDPPHRAVVTRLQPEVPDDVAGAISWGVACADSVANTGADLLLLSAGDDARATVLAACLMGQDVVEALGWPAELGVDDRTWMAMAVDLRDGLRQVRGLRGRPQALLEALDSPVLAAATATLLQAAARRTPVLLDGYGALVSAVLAVRVARPAQGWFLVLQAADNTRTRRALTSLVAEPLLGLGLSSADGSGALICLGLLETACGLTAR